MSGTLRIWHPFTRAGVDPEPLRIVRGEGVYLYTDDGRKLIDAISSWWVNLHGHCHPRVTAAIAAQAARLEHVLLAGFSHEPAEEFAAALRGVLPAGLSHVFFSDDGSTAVEVALKLAAQYWRNVGRPKKTEFLAFEHGYHGDTVGAMSVSDDSHFTAAFDAMRFRVHRAHSAYCYRCPLGLRRESCNIDCAASLEMLLDAYHDRIAAVIAEPLLQGAGGMVVHPVEFLSRLREITARYNVLFIADEVLTGFGRTGRMFACDWAGVTPDLMCLSKGLTGGFLPMGATVTTSAVRDAFQGTGPEKTFFHGHSYTGNPLACAAGIASLEIFREEPVFDRIDRIADVHRQRLGELNRLPAVGDTRAIGAVGAVELCTRDEGYLSAIRAPLYRFFVDRNVLLRPLGNVVYVLPPYVITAEELHQVYDVIAEAIEKFVPVSGPAAG